MIHLLLLAALAQAGDPPVFEALPPPRTGAPPEKVAAALSGLVGFGAGDLWLRDRSRGQVHAGLEVAGILAATVGYTLAARAENPEQWRPGAALYVIGLGTVAGSRVTGIWSILTRELPRERPTRATP